MGIFSHCEYHRITSYCKSPDVFPTTDYRELLLAVVHFLLSICKKDTY